MNRTRRGCISSTGPVASRGVSPRVVAGITLCSDNLPVQMPCADDSV